MFYSCVYFSLFMDDCEEGIICCEILDLFFLLGSYWIDVGVGIWDFLFDYIEYVVIIELFFSDYLGIGEFFN